MTPQPDIGDYVRDWAHSPFATHVQSPWRATRSAEALILRALDDLEGDFRREADVAVHRSATVEQGAILKGPIVVGPHCLIAAGAFLRGGVYLAGNCVVGPGCELKSSFLSSGSRLAHFNFVGDSILGADVNLEAGAIIANHRNECADKTIRIRIDDEVVETGVDKFGALVGDGVRIGANAVIAPGALILPATVIARLELVDQSPR